MKVSMCLHFDVHGLLIRAKVEGRRGGVESTVLDVSGRKEMAILRRNCTIK